MADDEQELPNQRRRPPTTIDVKASEATPEPASEPQPADPAPETLAGTETAHEAEQTSSGEPPGGDGRRGRMGWRLLAGAAAGAAAVLAILAALWAGGVFGTSDDLTPRLAALEQQARDLANRPQAPAVEPRALSDLAARVAKLEAAPAAPRATAPDQALTARVAALETAVRPLADLRQSVDAANATARDAKSRADAAFEAAQKVSAPAVTPAQIDALSARVAALEQAVKSAEDKIARTAGADRVGRLAFLTAALRNTVERGEPFAQELAAAKPLAPDAAALAPLEPFAATGVPRTAALARELSQLTGPMLNAAGIAPREGGFLDRLQQNAERLVRVRPINQAPGDDPATVVARADVKAQHGDLAGAVSELGTLPPAVRAPAEPWIKKAQAQLAALAAARSLAESAIGTLSKAAP